MAMLVVRYSQQGSIMKRASDKHVIIDLALALHLSV
jgi:hypothetical protein